MTILIIAEHNNRSLAPATLSTVTAAKAIGGDIHVLVAGAQAQSVAEEAACIEGVSNVLLADHEAYKYKLAENMALLITPLASQYTHLLTPATSDGKNFLPQVAALLNVDQISDIIAVESSDTFKRPIYAGNAIATVKSCASIKVITVRATAFEKSPTGSSPTPIKLLSELPHTNRVSFIREFVDESNRPNLTTAKVVIAGGRALQNTENFNMLYSLADKLNAAVGASKAAVDAGYAPNDLQIGQTGKVVAPELYIAVGISGTIQHIAGITGSKIIVAINKDDEAPIFKVADYGIVGDLFDIVPQLIDQL